MQILIQYVDWMLFEECKHHSAQIGVSILIQYVDWMLSWPTCFTRPCLLFQSSSSTWTGCYQESRHLLTSQQSFNPHPVRGLDAIDQSVITRPRPTCFNPHPVRGLDAITPCERCWLKYMFQSSSSTWTGCYCQLMTYERLRICFNPHPVRGLDAILAFHPISWGMMRFNPHPVRGLDAIQTRSPRQPLGGMFQSSSSTWTGCYPVRL